MLTTAILTYEENGLPTNLLSVLVDHVVRDDDAVVVIPPDSGVQVQNPVVGTYEADFTPFQLDPSFSYTIYWAVITLAGLPRSPTTQMAGAGQDSRAMLRRRVGRLLLGRDRFGYGPVTAATVNSVSARFVRRFPNGYFNGRDLYVVSGIGYGQEGIIANSTQGSGELEVSPAWETQPNLSSAIEVWSDRVTPDDVNDALNLAISDASDICLIREDRQLALSGLPVDRLSVELPTDFTHIFQVEALDTASWTVWDRTNADPQELYTIRNRRVYFSAALSSALTQLWVRGYRRPRRLLNDQDIAELPADYLVYMAAFLLDAGAAEGQALDPEQHAGRAGNWYRQALLRRNEVLTTWQPNTRAVL